MKNKKSFTLIELLVVIAIIGMFAALMFPNFLQILAKSRDMRRKSDLRAIQKAFELYKQSQSTPVYPPNTFAFSGTFSDANGVYMQTVPQDPQGVGKTYSYSRNAGDFGKYTLCACLENANDPDGVATCTGAPACASGKYYNLNEP